MNKAAVVIFDSERQAYEGSRALRELHREGSITVYADAVITKDASGRVSLSGTPEPGPGGALSGFLIGSLVGLLGGPVGIAVGASSGTMIGAAFDLTRATVGDDFVAEVSKSLLPGKAAVVTEIDEEWQTPLDARMEALGGQVLRRNRIEVEDAFFEKEIAAYQAELDALEAELSKASAERKAHLEARVQASRRKLQAKREELKARIESVKQEGDAKVESLQQQIAAARDERREVLKQRLEKARAEYRERTAKLQQAWDLTKSALRF
ncbi:MAG TPA: DUF1269 domain-containing protein [Thermoanaerobaculaceae bacterium]|nr:DUF1269 domain-containing protein [Thermoanaerobaculaceae bacterium]